VLTGFLECSNSYKWTILLVFTYSSLLSEYSFVWMYFSDLSFSFIVRFVSSSSSLEHACSWVSFSSIFSPGHEYFPYNDLSLLICFANHIFFFFFFLIIYIN